MFIFDWYRRSSAVAIPVKYECASKNLTGTFARSKILLTEKLTNRALVTPTPDQQCDIPIQTLLNSYSNFDYICDLVQVAAPWFLISWPQVQRTSPLMKSVMPYTLYLYMAEHQTRKFRASTGNQDCNEPTIRMSSAVGYMHWQDWLGSNLVLGLHPANERPRYFVTTTSLIGNVHTYIKILVSCLDSNYFTVGLLPTQSIFCKVSQKEMIINSWNTAVYISFTLLWLKCTSAFHFISVSVSHYLNQCWFIRPLGNK